MTQSGLHPTAGQVAANTQEIQELTDRFSQLSDYDVKVEATSKFAVGSSQISPADLEQLKKLAQTAVQLTGYLHRGKGFCRRNRQRYHERKTEQ